MSLRFITALVLSIVCLPTPVRADFETVKDAYNRGDYATVLNELRPLAEQGDANAQFNLGVLYYNGEGVSQDYVQARQWFEKAAAQGYVYAQHSLGVLYYKGQGVLQDYVQAHMWYSLAAENGYEIATGYRDDLAQQMTPTQIAEAQKLAREWKPFQK